MDWSSKENEEKNIKFRVNSTRGAFLDETIIGARSNSQETVYASFDRLLFTINLYKKTCFSHRRLVTSSSLSHECHNIKEHCGKCP